MGPTYRSRWLTGNHPEGWLDRPFRYSGLSVSKAVIKGGGIWKQKEEKEETIKKKLLTETRQHSDLKHSAGRHHPQKKSRLTILLGSPSA